MYYGYRTRNKAKSGFLHRAERDNRCTLFKSTMHHYRLVKADGREIYGGVFCRGVHAAALEALARHSLVKYVESDWCRTIGNGFYYVTRCGEVWTSFAGVLLVVGLGEQGKLMVWDEKVESGCQTWEKAFVKEKRVSLRKKIKFVLDRIMNDGKVLGRYGGKRG